MWPNPQETADLATFTEKGLIGKKNFYVQCVANADFTKVSEKHAMYSFMYSSKFILKTI